MLENVRAKGFWNLGSGRRPKPRFLDLGRLYPGGGKQWSAPVPTLLWRCCVGPVGCLGAQPALAGCCACLVRSVRAAYCAVSVLSFARRAAACAACGLAVLACCCVGHVPSRGPYCCPFAVQSGRPHQPLPCCGVAKPCPAGPLGAHPVRAVCCIGCVRSDVRASLPNGTAGRPCLVSARSAVVEIEIACPARVCPCAAAGCAPSF